MSIHGLDMPIPPPTPPPPMSSAATGIHIVVEEASRNLCTGHEKKKRNRDWLLQFRFIQNIYTTNILLHKMGLSSDKCLWTSNRLHWTWGFPVHKAQELSEKCSTLILMKYDKCLEIRLKKKRKKNRNKEHRNVEKYKSHYTYNQICNIQVQI